MNMPPNLHSNPVNPLGSAWKRPFSTKQFEPISLNSQGVPQAKTMVDKSSVKSAIQHEYSANAIKRNSLNGCRDLSTKQWDVDKQASN